VKEWILIFKKQSLDAFFKGVEKNYLMIHHQIKKIIFLNHFKVYSFLLFLRKIGQLL